MLELLIALQLGIRVIHISPYKRTVLALVRIHEEARRDLLSI